MSGDDTGSTWMEGDPSATLRPARQPASAMVHERLADAVPVELSFTETLGTGGMGVVRLAEQPRMGRTVAVKSIRASCREQAPKLLEEAWITGSLQHPNIVPIYDIAVDAEGAPHILMKRIEGIEWRQVIDDADTVQERFGAPNLLLWNLGILATVSYALAYAHARGVLHRDLKPANVMIGAFGEVYLVDWGIAVPIESPSARRIAGTPRYLAPEMVAGGHAGPATDVYLLGGVLHRILTGKPPHRGLTIEAILEGIPTFEPSYGPEVPTALAAIATRALAVDPADRFPDVEAFRSALRTFLERRPSLELSAQADRALASLEQALTGQDAMPVYEVFAACRFGYTEALRSWPDNPEAREGWQHAIQMMVSYELDHGAPEAARVLAAELDQVDPALRTRLDEALEAWEAEQHRLQQLALDADLSIGARTRTFLVGLFGLLWVAAALLPFFWRGTVTYPMQLIASVGSMIGVSIYLVWARRSLFATPTNRTTSLLLLSAPVSHTLLTVLLWILQVTPEVLVALNNFIFGLLSLAGTIAVDSRAWPAPLAFFLAAFASALDPSHGLVYQAGGLVVFTLAMLRLWLPSLPGQPVYRD